MSSARVTLDNPVFAGRLRDFGRGTPFVHQPTVRAKPQNISDVFVAPTNYTRPEKIVAPSQPRQDRSAVLQRNITTAPSIVVTKPRKQYAQKIMMAMATLVFVAGAGVAYMGFQTNKDVEAQVSAVTQGEESNDTVAEEKPSNEALRKHAVSPTLPRYVRISKIGVEARVMRQGIDKKGALKAPLNVHDAGWYENSSKPGEAGAVLLDGHVSGPTQRGVFYNLKKVTKGDLIEVERGDGTKFTYKVVKSKTAAADKTDMSEALLSAEIGKPGLNLITCTGKYDAKKGTYDDRIIVYAVQQ